MQFLHRLTGIVVFLVLLGMGVFLLGAARSSDAWTESMAALGHSRLGGLCAGTALICVSVLYALSAMPRRSRGQFLSYDGEGGTVSISTDAIADYITKLAVEFPSVVRMRTRVLPGRRSIDVFVTIRIKGGPEIHEACELLQKRIRESLSSGLGISEIGRVEVSIDEIAAQHKPV